MGDNVAANEGRLREYIADHVKRIKTVRKDIDKSAEAKRRMVRSNRSGGPGHRIWEARKDAVVNELLYRDSRDARTTTGEDSGIGNPALANNIGSSSEVGTVPQSSTVTVVAPPDERDPTSTLFTAQYAIDNQRIADEMTMFDLG